MHYIYYSILNRTAVQLDINILVLISIHYVRTSNGINIIVHIYAQNCIFIKYHISICVGILLLATGQLNLLPKMF
jgi:hypothetical protein